MRKLTKFLNSDLLTVSALLGMGIKLGPVPVLDEIGLIIHSLLHLNSSLKVRVNIYGLTLVYFTFIYLIGFISSHNINALRFVLIGGLLLFYGNIGDSPNTGKSILTASFLFLISSIIIPAYGLYYGFEFAWWQQGLWTGTSYAAIGVFASATVIVVLSKKVLTAFVALLMMYYVGILSDSRLTFCLLVVVGLVCSLRIKNEVLSKKSSKTVVRLTIKWAFLIVLVLLCVSKLTETVHTYSGRAQFSILAQTMKDLASGDRMRDWDRKAFNKAVFSLTSDEPLSALIGSGGLSHQIDMAKYIRRSVDGRVRPVGFSAIVFDGGWLLFSLILASSVKTFFYIYRKCRFYPLYLKIATISFPVVALFSVFVTNSLDAVLFWLMICPMGLASSVIRCWNYRFSSELQ